MNNLGLHFFLVGNIKKLNDMNVLIPNSNYTSILKNSVRLLKYFYLSANIFKTSFGRVFCTFSAQFVATPSGTW